MNEAQVIDLFEQHQGFVVCCPYIGNIWHSWNEICFAFSKLIWFCHKQTKLYALKKLLQIEELSALQMEKLFVLLFQVFQYKMSRFFGRSDEKVGVIDEYMSGNTVRA